MVVRILLTTALMIVGTVPGAAKDCRIPDAPPGVRVQLPPGCRPVSNEPKPNGATGVRRGAEPGFIDLGNGTQVRIGGRVRVDAVSRH